MKPEDSSETSEIVKTLILDTTAHGFRNAISTTRNKKARAIWLVVVLGMTVGLVISLHEIWKRYNTHPFFTVTEFEPQTELFFPTITLCDISYLDTSKFNNSEEVFQFFEQYSSLRYGFNVSAGSEAVGNMTIDAVFNISSITYIERFKFCMWENKIVGCDEIWEPVFTDMGRCFKFNWNTTNRRKAKTSGAKGGLRFVASINQRGYILSDLMAAGLKMVIQDPHEYPQIDNNGITIAPSLSTLIGLRQTSFQFLDAPFEAYGNQSCVNNDEFSIPKIKHHGVYDRGWCIRRCFGEIIVNNCSCKSMVETDVVDKRYCTLKEIKECYLAKLDALYRDSHAASDCDCPHVCSFNKFLKTVSVASFPSVPGLEVLQRLNLLPDERYLNQYFDVSIFFEDLMLETITHVPEYSYSSLAGIIGGQMGLFLGVSFVTLTELAELVCWSLVLGWRKLKQVCLRPKLQPQNQ